MDNDCDTEIDEGVESTFYVDADGDGFGGSGTSLMACTVPAGYTGDNSDCNDASRYEQPNQTWYLDGDDDGWSAGSTQVICERPNNTYWIDQELVANYQHVVVDLKVFLGGTYNTTTDSMDDTLRSL